MEAIGIVAEYNPFHKGHLYHIQETKKKLKLPVVAAISGSVMQRGEPAFADKWLRARMAVECGVDLVLELPTAFSLRSAQFFAAGGVELLAATGVVRYLSCGAENCEVDYTAIAQLMQTAEAQSLIRGFVQQGQPYAKACELALNSLTAGQISSALALKPNNILALEYAKALLNTKIEQLVISRNGSNYNDTSLSSLASASAVRQAYSHGEHWQSAVPDKAAQLMLQNPAAIGYDESKLWDILCYKLRTSSAQQISASTECTEGLENLLLDTSNAASFAEAITSCTNKRYPASRIRRLFMQLLMSKARAYFEQEKPAYLRVLAFSETGRQLLSEMKVKASLPIITKLGRNPFQNQSQAFQQQLELDITASNIIGLLRSKPTITASDYLTSPYYLKQ